MENEQDFTDDFDIHVPLQKKILAGMENKEVYVWVKASEPPKEDGIYVCRLEKKEHGVRTEIASFMEYRTVYGAFHDNNDGFKVIEWLEAQTLPLQECYVPVSKDEWFALNQEQRHQLWAGRDLNTGEPVWLKKLSLPLKEQEDVEALAKDFVNEKYEQMKHLLYMTPIELQQWKEFAMRNFISGYRAAQKEINQ
jgi:hypothetical protein